MSKLIFAEIPKLTDNWWLDQPLNNPKIVWTVWNKDAYYLWGANVGNYQIGTIGSVIGGGGMAGSNGPTRGRHHPHYVGVITMDSHEMPKNKAVFDSLETLVQAKKNVVVPIYNTASPKNPEFKFSLGTGIGGSQPHWDVIQKNILNHIITLSKLCTDIVIPNGTYWPDCTKPQPYPRYPITSIKDIQDIVDNVL